MLGLAGFFHPFEQGYQLSLTCGQQGYLICIGVYAAFDSNSAIVFLQPAPHDVFRINVVQPVSRPDNRFLFRVQLRDQLDKMDRESHRLHCVPQLPMTYIVTCLIINATHMHILISTFLNNNPITLSPCPVKSRPTSGDCHDHFPPGVSISC